MTKQKCQRPKCKSHFWTRLKDRTQCRKHEGPLVRLKRSPRIPPRKIAGSLATKSEVTVTQIKGKRKGKK